MTRAPELANIPDRNKPGRLTMRAFAVLVLALISSTSFAATSERFGRGGWYKDFQPEIERANSSGELFRITGHCQSNCTLFLGLRNVCVERSATLLFHAVMTASATSTPAPPSGC
jgi:hypothetical protein